MGKCPIVLDKSGQDIHAEVARIRAEGPVTRVELPGGVLAWSVTSFELAKGMLTDARFAKDKKNWPAFVDGEIPGDWPLITWVVMENMTTRDGAEHARLRRLVAQGFSPRQVESSRPLIEKVASDLLDALAALPAGQVVDLKANYSYPLPAQVICTVCGVPEEAQGEVLHGSVVNSNTNNTGEEAAANLAQWQGAMGRLIDAKRANPGDDLTSLMIAAREDDGTRLTDEEMAGTLHLMTGAGSETLSNVMSHAVIGLLSHPDQLEQVLDGRVGWDAVIEETLRAEGAVSQLPFRYATEDVEIGGVTIAKGDAILIAYAGIGRDPDVHGETADEFDINRADKSHLSFGHGPHRCLGMSFARLQASIALPALFERFPDIRLAVPVDQLQPQGTFIMNGHDSLPVYLRAPVGAAV